MQRFVWIDKELIENGTEIEGSRIKRIIRCNACTLVMFLPILVLNFQHEKEYFAIDNYIVSAARQSFMTMIANKLYDAIDSFDVSRPTHIIALAVLENGKFMHLASKLDAKA